MRKPEEEMSFDIQLWWLWIKIVHKEKSAYIQPDQRKAEYLYHWLTVTSTNRIPEAKRNHA